MANMVEFILSMILDPALLVYALLGLVVGLVVAIWWGALWGVMFGLAAATTAYCAHAASRG